MSGNSTYAADAPNISCLDAFVMVANTRAKTATNIANTPILIPPDVPCTVNVPAEDDWDTPLLP
jgi:hypothetical protein